MISQRSHYGVWPQEGHFIWEPHNDFPTLEKTITNDSGWHLEDWHSINRYSTVHCWPLTLPREAWSLDQARLLIQLENWLLGKTTLATAKFCPVHALSSGKLQRSSRSVPFVSVKVWAAVTQILPARSWGNPVWSIPPTGFRPQKIWTKCLWHYPLTVHWLVKSILKPRKSVWVPSCCAVQSQRLRSKCGSSTVR